MEETGVRFVALDAAAYVRQVNNAAKAVENHGNEVTKAAAKSSIAEKTMSSFAKNVGKDFAVLGTTVKVATAVGLAGVTAFVGKSIQASSNLTESINAINVVFREGAKPIQEYGKTAANTVGLSQRAFNELVTPLGAMLLNAGNSADVAAEKTIKLTERAADMASVFNTDVRQALGAVTAALRGEADPIERYGVSLQGAAVDAKAAELGLKKVGGEFDNNAKQAARVALILEQTNRVAGDFTNTIDGQANKARVLSATLEDTQAAFGKAFGPTVQSIMGSVVSIIGDPAFTEGLQDFGTYLVVIIEGFRTGVQGIVIPSLQWLIGNIPILTAAVTTLGIAFAFFHPGAALLIGLGAVITSIGLVRADLRGMPPEVIRVQISFLNMVLTIGKAFNKLAIFITDVINAPIIAVNKAINAIIRQANRIPGVNISQIEPDLPFGSGGENTLGNSLLVDIALRLQNAMMDLDDSIARTAETAAAATPEIKNQAAATEEAGEKAKKTQTYAERLAEALEDGIITLQENIDQELNLTAARAGELEAGKFLERQLFDSEEQIFNFGKQVASLGVVAASGEKAFSTFVKSMSDGALELQRAASEAIFGRPTREEATLQLQIAEIERVIAGIDATSGPATEAAKQRQAKLNEQIDNMREGLDRNVDSINDSRDVEIDRLREQRDAIEVAKGATDQQRKNVEDQKKAIDRQIDALQKSSSSQIDALRKATDEQVKAKQREIEQIETSQNAVRDNYQRLADQLKAQLDLMQRENEIQKLQILLADQTLPNELAQNNAVIAVKDNMLALSTVSANLSKSLGESLIPNVDAAAKAAKYFTEVFSTAGIAIPGRANGGPVLAGHPYWVGEKGIPELFVPNQAGMVVPSLLPVRLPPSVSTTYNNDNRMSVSATLPNVVNGDQFADQIERRQSRRIRLGQRGLIL